jgi:undecaprenyl-diphosphatase
MLTIKILVLAIVQGVCELLPVSSSAHVILAEKLMGIDPTAPDMTLLLVMLHTGTMLAVIVYFRKSWGEDYFASRSRFWDIAKSVTVATIITGAIGVTLMQFIERVVLRGSDHAEVEQLFGNNYVIASGLALVGVLIILSGRHRPVGKREIGMTTTGAAWIGAVQGLCLPFRGFSRSGATISTGLFLGFHRERVAAFSFALAVVLTPAVVAKEGYRLFRAHPEVFVQGSGLYELLWPSLLGMVFSFVAGLIALRWLSRWLEQGRWSLFGYYCLAASAVVLVSSTMTR